MSSCVWYVSKYVAPPGGPGGVGGRGYELMRELAAAGDECVIITSDANHLVAVPEVEESMLIQRRDGMQVCWLRTMKSPRARSLRRIGGWLHFEWRLFRLRRRSLPRPDVVIISSLSLLTVMNGVWLKRRLGVRLVFEVRDIWPLTLVDEGGLGRRNPLVLLLGLIERLGYRSADAIVGTMPNLSEHVAGVMGRELPVHCIPMGYSPRALAQAAEVPEDFVDTYVPADRFTVVYAGTIGRANALGTYFAAAEALRDRPELHFLVMGDGALLEQYRQRFGHLPNLTFVPKVAKDVVPSLLARCDLLYLSTHEAERWNYGQSLNKLIDYMLAGRPILASYSGFDSMIAEAGCGTIVPAGDVPGLVLELTRYAELAEAKRDEMGRLGRSWVLEHRSFPELARQYRQILFPRS